MKILEKLLAETTQGPWVWQAENECLVGPEQIVLAQDDEGRMTFAQYPDGMHFNNANLIALAPSLAAALLVAEKALRDISRQKKTDELETEYDVECADFEGGYDACVDTARAALSEIEKLTGGGE